MINPTISSTYVPESDQVPSREIQLFEPLPDALYTIETTSRIVDVPRRTILVYCKHHLLSPATGTVEHGYYFDRDAIHTLRRIDCVGTYDYCHERKDPVRRKGVRGPAVL
jgi:hypothetical protein